MGNELFAQKAAVRAEMRSRARGIRLVEKTERSLQIVQRITESPFWSRASQVLLFAPLPTEPDIDLLWRGETLAGKRMVYPRVEGTTLRLYCVDGLSELERSRWELREPPRHIKREVKLDDVSLALVPGMAFDVDGGRLGRGGGYYDRLLAQRDSKKTRLVGVAFAFQLVAEPLPRAPHDVRMDEVCTD